MKDNSVNVIVTARDYGFPFSNWKKNYKNGEYKKLQKGRDMIQWKRTTKDLQPVSLS